MNKKGMMPMDMRSLLTLFEAIKHVCTYQKGKPESFEKSSNKGKKGKNALVPILRPGCQTYVSVTYLSDRMNLQISSDSHQGYKAP
jgi:hypothetical protein